MMYPRLNTSRSLLGIIPEGCFAFASISLGIAFLLHRAFSQKSASRRLPPSAPVGFLEIFNVFFARDAPLYMLNLRRRIKESIFTLPLAPPGIKFVVVADYRMARTILEDLKSTKPLTPYEFFDSTAGGSTFFTANDNRYRHVRKSTNPAYSSHNVPRMEAIIDDVIGTWITNTLIPHHVTPQKPVEFAAVMPHLTLAIIGRVAFAYDFSSTERSTILTCIRECYLEYTTRTPKNPFRRLLGSMFPGVRKARQCTKELRSLARHLLDHRRIVKNREETVMIDMFLEDEQYTSDEERISDIILYLAGGFDSAAYSICWLLLELAKHPDEQEKLRAAIRDDSRHQELKRAVREILRLHPAAAMGSLRAPASDISIPGSDAVIPAGSWCMMPYFLMHRDGSVYENPDDFVPSRWENPSEEALKAFMPFSMGRRSCQGQGLANLEISIIVSRLLSRYQFELVDEGVPDYFVTLKPAGMQLLAKPIAGR